MREFIVKFLRISVNARVTGKHRIMEITVSGNAIILFFIIKLLSHSADGGKPLIYLFKPFFSSAVFRVKQKYGFKFFL